MGTLVAPGPRPGQPPDDPGLVGGRALDGIHVPDPHRDPPPHESMNNRQRLPGVVIPGPQGHRAEHPSVGEADQLGAPPLDPLQHGEGPDGSRGGDRGVTGVVNPMGGVESEGVSRRDHRSADGAVTGAGPLPRRPSTRSPRHDRRATIGRAIARPEAPGPPSPGGERGDGHRGRRGGRRDIRSPIRRRASAIRGKRARTSGGEGTGSSRPTPSWRSWGSREATGGRVGPHHAPADPGGASRKNRSGSSPPWLPEVLFGIRRSGGTPLARRSELCRLRSSRVSTGMSRNRVPPRSPGGDGDSAPAPTGSARRDAGGAGAARRPGHRARVRASRRTAAPDLDDRSPLLGAAKGDSDRDVAYSASFPVHVGPGLRGSSLDGGR